MKWLAAVALACMIAGPAAAQAADDPPPSVAFGLRSNAVYATRGDDGGRLRVRFRGEGQADLTRASAALTLEELTQVDGGGTLVVTPDGDLTRVGRARVYAGTGTAQVNHADGTTTFQRVRIVVGLRGHGKRVRLIGKYVARTGVDAADSDTPTPPDILRGVVRGRPILVEEPSE